MNRAEIASGGTIGRRACFLRAEKSHGTCHEQQVRQRPEPVNTFIIIIFSVVSVTIGAVLLVAFSVVIAAPVTRGAMFHPSARIRVKTALDHLPMTQEQYLVDLGCGDGRVIRAAARLYGARCRGYEINPLPFVIAWVLSLGRPQVSVRWRNFWREDLGKADVVFCYLFPDVMPQLAGKLREELRPGCRVVSCNFPLPGWTPVKMVRPSATMYNDPIYFYEQGPDRRQPTCRDT